jgi:hypothetical protein
MALVFMMTAALLFSPDAWAAKEKPTIIKPCQQCHQPAKETLRGKLKGVSMKTETINISIGPANWLVGFDAKTALVGAEAFNKIPNGKEIAIDIRRDGDQIYATRVRVKPPAQVPAEKLIKVDELAQLVSGEKKGTFTIVDARPGKRYHEGHIPGSVLNYDAQFSKDVLPIDRDQLLIFYCGGPS